MSESEIRLGEIVCWKLSGQEMIVTGITTRIGSKEYLCTMCNTNGDPVEKLFYPSELTNSSGVRFGF